MWITRARTAHRGNRPNLKNRNSDPGEIGMLNILKNLYITFQDNRRFFLRFCGDFVLFFQISPPPRITKTIKEIVKNLLTPYPPSTFVGNTLKKYSLKFQINGLDIRRNILRNIMK